MDHVVFGNALQTSADAIYLARHIALKSGCRVETPAVTVNRLCGSGFEAIVQGVQQILLGESRIVLAGGAESMSQAPHVVRGARWGLRLGPAPPFEDSLWEALRDTQCGLSMAETAEASGDRYRLSRAGCGCGGPGEPAARPGRLGRAAPSRTKSSPVPITNRKTRQAEPWAADEHMRPDTTPEGLAKLPPYFKKDGVVTAGNASGICDGAAAVILAGAESAKAHGLTAAWGGSSAGR